MKEYAVLCAECAERMRELFRLEKAPCTQKQEPDRHKRCRTCLKYGSFSEYIIRERA